MTEQDILDVAKAYSQHVGLSLSTLSLYATDDGKFLGRLADGKSCTLKRANEIMRWFSDNWPGDLNWPEGIRRPAPRKRVAA